MKKLELVMGLALVLPSYGCVTIGDSSSTSQQEQGSGLTGPSDVDPCPVAARLEAKIVGADTVAVGDSTLVSFTPFTAENQEIPDDCNERAGIKVEDVNGNCVIFLGQQPFFPQVTGANVGTCKIVGTVPGATASVEITVI